jgi:hypothetical protein
VSVLAHNRVVALRYATIVCTQSPIPATALNVHLHPEGSAYRRITQATMEQLADEFQPYLLRYRLTRHREVGLGIRRSSASLECSNAGTSSRRGG